MLVIQDILRSLADDSVRQDFLDGTNGAVKIEQSDMDLLEKLYVEVTPKRPTRSDEPTFTQSATHSANTFSSVIDSRPKPFGESTYDHVKETLQSIQNCGYFEKEIIQVETKQPKTEQAAENLNEVGGAGEDEEKSSETEINPDAIEAPGASAVPQPEGLIMHMNNQQSQIAVQGIQQLPNAKMLSSVPVAAGAPVVQQTGAVPMPVTTVRAIEQTVYYKQYMQQPPQPTLRPIHEVIGTGNFHFLQDSELDSSDLIMTTAPYQQALPPHPSPQQKLPTAPMVPGIPNAHPPTAGATQVLSNSTPHENVTPIIPQQQQQPPQVNQISLSGGQPPQSTFPNPGTFPSMAQPTMFNSNVLKQATDQPHIPPFTNVSPQIPIQVPVGSAQIPGFAMNQPSQNAMVQIAQLQSMIQQQQQQQQQLSGSIQVSQPIKQDLVNADDLTEKLKSTLHINDNNSKNNSGPVNDNVLKSSPSSLTNHHNEVNTQDWNDVSNDANSWSNQMAEESNRNERYKRNSGGNSNIGGIFRSSDKYGGNTGGTYRPRNTYQNGNRGMSNSGGGDNSSSGVFFRNNDRYYQNGSKDTSYGKSAGNGNIGYSKPPRTDMLNNRPPRMQSGPPGEYRSRPGQGNGRDNRGGLKA